ncbi:MAG: hypothetical protein IT445_18300 [Phycisphaeraceae bacterium]|nr:hypothetical protein [Phycisphaeraceae bacterium]
MASIFKRKKYAPVPSAAEVVEINSGKGPSRLVARWVDNGGVSHQAEVDRSLRFGDRIVVGESKCWYIAYDTPAGRKHRKAYTDKAASFALAERLQREVARRREGLIDAYDDYAKLHINQHVADP